MNMIQCIIAIAGQLLGNVVVAGIFFVCAVLFHLVAKVEQVRDFLKIEALPEEVLKWEGVFLIVAFAWSSTLMFQWMHIRYREWWGAIEIRRQHYDIIRKLPVEAVLRLKMILRRENDYYQRADLALYELFSQKLVRELTREEENLRGEWDAVRHVKAVPWVEALWEKRPDLFQD